MTILNFSKPSDQVWSGDVFLANKTLPLEPLASIEQVVSVVSKSPDLGIDLLAGGSIMLRGYVTANTTIPVTGNNIGIINLPIRIKASRPIFVLGWQGVVGGSFFRAVPLLISPGGQMALEGLFEVASGESVGLDGIILIPDSEIFSAAPLL